MLSVSFLAATLNKMIFIAVLTGVHIAERAVRNFSIVLFGPGVGRPHESVKQHIQMYMTLLNLLSTKSNKPEVQSVQTGFPKHFGEDVCFSCLENDENVHLLKNCTVEVGETIPAGAASIGLRRSRLENDFHIGYVGVLVGGMSDAPYGRMYSGDGALTYIGDHAVALFFHRSVALSGRLELGYMEHDNEAQLSALSKHFVENADNPNTWAETTWVKTQVSV